MIRPLRTILVRLACIALALHSAPVAAQEQPARRLSSIVGVAVEEYAKGVDARGRLTSQQEYDEAVAFIADAREVAERLSGTQAAAVRAPLDSIAAAVAAKRPPADLVALHNAFVAALGTEGALELPAAALDLAAGRALFGRNCASCHGETGAGDGPAAKGLKTPPSAIGSAKAMADASPALLYRVISVGVSSTPMPGWAGTLSSQDRWNLVAYLQSLRASPADRREGEGLYLQRCASCHGNTGRGDGPSSRALSKAPAEIGAFAWHVERSDAMLAAAIRNGIPRSAMPPARDLSDDQLAKLVAYVRSLPLAHDDVRAVAAGIADTSASGVSRRVLGVLDQAMVAARSGRTDEAGDKAFDAYLAFEPLETSARAKKPGLVATMERHFADFKGAVKAGDVRGAQESRDEIAAALPDIVDLTQRATSAWTAFLQSFLIILREGFEAILVIGAVAAFLRKTGHEEKLRSIWLGVAAGIVASGVTAVILATVLHAMPASAEIIGGVTMLIAVAVLFSVSYWLISKVEAAKWQQFIKEKVNNALEHGGSRALVFIAFLAVYREGAETALFYQALFAEATNVFVPLSLGIVIGFAALAVIFTLFYRFGVRIPLRPFFAVTSGLLYYMAFVFAGRGIRELQEGNVAPITILPHLPSIDAMGIYPTLETLGAQLVLIALLAFALVKTFWPKRSVTLPIAQPPSTELAARVAALEDRIEQLETSRQSSAISRQHLTADD